MAQHYAEKSIICRAALEVSELLQNAGNKVGAAFVAGGCAKGSDVFVARDARLFDAT